MNNSPTLLVLAAGMATRYGQLKQIDQFGPSGETILDYSVYDAIRSGFKKVVFVIRESIKEDFLKSIAGKFDPLIQVDTVCQEMDILPDGFSLSSDRVKPWGTGHAIWAASDLIHEPFAVINADDFYGQQAIALMADFLKTNDEECVGAMIGYQLNNTLSEHGFVSRGICELNKADFLESIEEHTRIMESEDGIESYQEDEIITLQGNETVSMNLMGFKPNVFSWFEKYFISFLESSQNNLKAEFYLPAVANNLVENKIMQIKVLPTSSQWFGVTYPGDKELAISKIKELTDQGIYPDNLWKQPIKMN